MKVHTGVVCAVLWAGCLTDQVDDLATSEQSVVSDAANGGTAGFYFLAPLVDPPTFSGTFDGTWKPRSRLRITNVDCGGAGMVGAQVYSTTQIQVYPTSELYKKVVNVGTLGLVTGNCYRIFIDIDVEPLGYRDVQVTSGT